MKNRITLSIFLVVILLIILTFIINNKHKVSTSVKDGELFGTLIPSKNNKVNTAVLIVAGSGSTDRDGNSQLQNGKNDSLKALAYSLYDKGITTLRYDKRTSGKSAKNFNLTNGNFEDYVNDCVAWIKYLKNNGYNNIYLLGHSQGALVCTLAAQQETVDGFISIAGAARSIDEIIDQQIQNIPTSLYNEGVKILKSLKAGNRVENVSQDLMQLFAPELQDFLISWIKYNPTEELQKLDIPMLFINGSTDIQVDESELKYFEKVKPDAQTIIIEGMNHVLKNAPNDVKENMKRYNDPSYEINQELIYHIVSFLEQN